MVALFAMDGLGMVAVMGVANKRGRGTNLGRRKMETKLKQKFEHKL